MNEPCMKYKDLPLGMKIISDRLYSAGHMAGGAPEGNESATKEIVQLDKNGNFVADHLSMKDAAEAVEGKEPAVSMCCRGIRAHHRGFKFVYKEVYYGN